MPESAAAALAGWPTTKEEAGVLKVRAMLRDAIRAALRAGNRAHAGGLFRPLGHFPERARSRGPSGSGPVPDGATAARLVARDGANPG